MNEQLDALISAAGEAGRHAERVRIISLLISEDVLYPDEEDSQAIIELILEDGH